MTVAINQTPTREWGHLKPSRWGQVGLTHSR